MSVRIMMAFPLHFYDPDGEYSHLSPVSLADIALQQRVGARFGTNGDFTRDIYNKNV